MIALEVVDLSRLQFAITALYHFLFVPLTLGLVFLIAIMETVYVMTGRPIWRHITKFWGVLFGINFAMGVATGITMEFQFGTNWAYYSHYVGDVFGSLLAIEGLMAFFLEATLIGLFFFGWNKLSKTTHLIVTWCLALATNFSALWILIANGWMQNPVGSAFNPDSLRMEMTSFYEVFFNPVAQAKFVHTLSSGYVTGSLFVLSISALYILRGKHIAFAKRSMTVAASFGLAAALSVVVLGDESGYLTTEYQQMKIAAMEGLWETEPAPASLMLFAIPNQEKMENQFEIKIPWLLGLIATRSFDGEVQGIKPLAAQAETRIRSGIIAYDALETVRNNPDNIQARALLDAHINDLGHGLLLKKYTDNIVDASETQIAAAAQDTIPRVAPLFWSFRIMVGLGLYFILLFAIAFYFTSQLKITQHRKFLKLIFYSLPLPWVAISLGWIVAEYGRQPWAIDSILPTFLGVSNISAANVMTTLIGFIVFYSILLIIDGYLMIKYINKGPEETLGIHLEEDSHAA